MLHELLLTLSSYICKYKYCYLYNTYSYLQLREYAAKEAKQ